MLEKIRESLRFYRRLCGSKLHDLLIRLRDERNLHALSSIQKSQIIVNYSGSANLLDSLCDRYGSDKGGSQNRFPWGSHSYTDFLSLLFETSREQMTLVFECGIGTNNLSIPANMGSKGIPGASLRVWRDYFPNAEVVGADIDEAVLFDEERIATYAVDQSSEKSVQDMWGRIGRSGFQLMIDDGLHVFEAGKTLFLGSVHLLAANGTYIIEDVKHDDMIKYMKFFGALDFRVDFVSLRRPPESGRPVPIGDNQLVLIRRSPKSL